MYLYFIRHGQSENNLMWEQSGSDDRRVADPGLTAAGQQQADCLARFLAAVNSPDGLPTRGGRDFHITHIYASLMERAVATGHKVAEALDQPLLGWVDIHETGGMFLYDKESESYVPQPGLARSLLMARYPRLVLPDEVTEEGWWNRPFEPEAARAPRACRVLEQLLDRHGDSDDGVVFVSHGGFYNYLLRAILGLPERERRQGLDPLWFSANNASIAAISFSDGRRAVRYLNRVDFLPRDLIT